MNENLKDVLGLSDQMKERIMHECKITRATLWNWANGKTPIPFWAKEKINSISEDILGKVLFEEVAQKNIKDAIKKEWSKYRKSMHGLDTDIEVIDDLLKDFEAGEWVTIISDSMAHGYKNIYIPDGRKLQRFLRRSISYEKAGDKINELAEGCRVSSCTIRSWMSGWGSIPKQTRGKIEEIAGEKIF